MAITATWHDMTGAGGAVGTALSNLVFGGTDDAATTATDDPIQQGANSVRRYLVVRFTETAGTSSQIANIVIDRSDSIGSGTNIDGTADGGTTLNIELGVAYAHDEDAALPSPTALGVSGGGTSLAITNTGASIEDGTGTEFEDSDDFVCQIDTSATAVAGSDALELRCSFDIIA